jgi:hypothetical protein
MRTCKIDGCQKKVQAKGWCTAHYTKWRRWRDPEGTGPLAPNGLTTTELFIRKINKTDTCWLWTGKIDTRGQGYGVFTYKVGGKPKTVGAHRFAYELWVGPIPSGLSIDHVYDRGCRFTHCVNPAHLEPITPAEQNRRYYIRQTHCKWGHEFTPENTRLSPEGHRLCKICTRRRTAASYRKSHPEDAPKAPLKTRCKFEHEFTPENTYINPAGARVCRECSRERTRRWQEKQRSLPS